MDYENELRLVFCWDFERIADLWKLQDSDRLKILDMDSMDSFRAYSSGAIESPTVLLRILCVIQIHNALRTLFSENKSANGWVHKPNKAKIFRGKPALDLMSSGNLKDLEKIRDYLMSECS